MNTHLRTRLALLTMAFLLLTAPAAWADSPGDDPKKPRPIATTIAEDAPDASAPDRLAAAVMTSINEDHKLTAGDGAADDEFGFSVSLDGNRALIGARADDAVTGSAYIFDFNGTTWTETHKLTPSDGNPADEFGWAVSLDGDWAFVGATRHDGSAGAVYVFDLSGTTPTETKLTASDASPNDHFGASVSLDGDRALIGANLDDDEANNAGAAYVFDLIGTTWTETQKFTASDGAFGDQFGASVSLDGDRALIGARWDDINGSVTGSAYIFDFDGTTWSQTQKLTAGDAATGDFFGVSVSLDGNRALIGASGDDNDQGAAYVFDFNGTAWGQTQKLTAGDGVAHDEFGFSVSLDGDRALIGALYDDDIAIDAGAAYVFDLSGTTWNQTNKLIASDAAASDLLGNSVSLDGGRALIGAFEDNNDQGAAYVFDIAGPTITAAPAAPFYWPLDVVTVNIDLDDVIDLLGVGGKLSYDDARMTFDDGSLVAGAFLDDGSTILFEDDDDAGVASLSVSRTSGAGATGSGTAASVTFTLPDEATPGPATFSLSDLLAVDPAGNPITLTPVDGSFDVGGVWPGDTDNNCTAEAVDLLPLGLNFGETGPARSGGFDITWSAKAFSPWGGSSSAPDFSDSFADATGDGEIDQNDVLPIGVNFGLTHAATTGCTQSAAAAKHAAAISLDLDAQPVGTVITVRLDLVEQTDGLVGTALKLAVDPSVMKVTSVIAGDFLDDGDLLNLVRLNDETGLSEAAFTRKGTERATSGTGLLAVMTLEVIAPMAGASELSLTEVKLSTASAGIFEASEQTVALRAETATSTAAEDAGEQPSTFTLHGAYPNPFNPATTVSFDLPQRAEVTLVVFDVLGREVSRVSAGEMAAGSRHTLRFEALRLASGTYLYRLEAQSSGDLSVQMGRFILLK